MSTSLKASSTPTDSRDRRRSARVPHVCEAWVCSPTSTNTDDRIEVLSLNISRHGVGFEIPKPLPAGTFWVIEIGVGEQRLCSEVRLVACTKTESGLYEVGAEFC